MHSQPTAGAESPKYQPNEKPLRVAQLAAEFDTDPSTIYRDIKAGRLVAYRIGKGRGAIRIPVASVEAYRARITAAALVEVA